MGALALNVSSAVDETELALAIFDAIVLIRVVCADNAVPAMLILSKRLIVILL
jgi:hypothetical protein